MGLKQTGAAPACHNSQGPTLPACEKRDLNPRNPFSWVRRLFSIPIISLPPNPIYRSINNSNSNNNNKTTIYKIRCNYGASGTWRYFDHSHYFTYLYLFWRAFGILLFSYYQSSIASLKFFNLPFSNIHTQHKHALSHKYIDKHVIHPPPSPSPYHPSPWISFNTLLNRIATGPGSIETRAFAIASRGSVLEAYLTQLLLPLLPYFTLYEHPLVEV